jgi:hypothetical protein
MAGETSSTGSEIKAAKDGVNVSLSDESVRTLAVAFVDAMDRWLAWAERNPFLFIAFLVFLLAAIAVWQKQRTERKMMRIEYRNRRDHAKVQLPLDLGESRERLPTGDR